MSEDISAVDSNLTFGLKKGLGFRVQGFGNVWDYIGIILGLCRDNTPITVIKWKR